VPPINLVHEVISPGIHCPGVLGVASAAGLALVDLDLEPLEPGEVCSRDKACKLANGEVSAAVGYFSHSKV
jgi:hypothetical protein